MTLDEAIKHCDEVAQENEKQFNDCPMKYDGDYVNNGKTACKCAEEHRQLAEWLKDYKRLLEQEPFMNKPCVARQVCHEDKVKVLAKIQAEIEQNAYPIVHGVNNHEKGMTLYGILQVIDKYMAESEET